MIPDAGPTKEGIAMALREHNVILPAGCDVEGLVKETAAANGCSCRTVGVGHNHGATGGLLFGGLMLVLAYRRRRRSN